MRIDEWGPASERALIALLADPAELARAELGDLAHPWGSLALYARAQAEAGQGASDWATLVADLTDEELAAAQVADRGWLASRLGEHNGVSGSAVEALGACRRAKQEEPESHHDGGAHHHSGGAGEAACPDLVRLDGMRIRPVTWVRPGWLALGKLTVLDGMPDVGKSTLAADWAARASSGRAFPGGEGFGAPVGVLIAAADEDGVADTILPRLVAAGADLSRVHVLRGMREPGGQNRPFALPADLGTIAALVERLGVRFIYLDSLMAALPGKVDSYRDQDVRLALHPLAKLAEETQAAVLFNRHPTKGGLGAAMYRGGGSVGIVAVARSGLLALRDPDDATGARRLLAVTKCNLVHDEDKATVAFSIISAEASDDPGQSVRVGRVEWGEVDPRGAEELVHAQDGAGDESARDARELILDALADGPLTAPILQEEVTEQGVGRHAFERERAALRRARRITVTQPGREDGGRGRQEAVWAICSSGQAAGTKCGGSRHSPESRSLRGISGRAGICPPTPGVGEANAFGGVREPDLDHRNGLARGDA